MRLNMLINVKSRINIDFQMLSVLDCHCAYYNWNMGSKHET